MKRIHQMMITAAALSGLLLTGCGLSLAEDVTPPPNYRPPATSVPDQQAAAVGTVFPLVPPDPQAGASIYAEKCLPCHGEQGMGDGPQAANLPNPAAPVGSPALARASRPSDWFRIVTEGNLEKFMPGFTGSLNDRQRWDVVAYTFSLSTTTEELEQGAAIYQENCAACHGANGQGDGEQAAGLDTKPANWTEQERLADLSADDIVGVISGAVEGHVSFADAIDEDGRYAAAAFVRSLSFAGGGPQAGAQASVETPAPQSTGSAESTAEPAGTPDAGDNVVIPAEINVTGSVTHASGGSVPENLQVKVRAFSGMSPLFEELVPVEKDGSFRLEGVEFTPELIYFAQVEANGLTFSSEIVHGQDVTGPEITLPVQIYDTTTDIANLRTDRLHVFFDFTSVPGKIQVVNLFIISNNGQQVVVAPEAEGAVLRFALPEGAENLQFEDGELGGRYVATEDGFGDRMAIGPGAGQHQVLFAYELPYDRKLSFSLVPPLPVDAAIVMVPPAGVKVKSDQLTDTGQRDVQGMAFQMYQAMNGLEAGAPLNISLSGKAGAAGEQSEENQLTYLMIGVGVFGLALAGAGYWLYLQRQKAAGEVEDLEAVEAEEEESSEAVLDAIVALDDLHASGGLPEGAYQERRAVLKDRLAAAMAREGQ